MALYFAWLGHYTCALCVPAVLGTILYAGLWGRGQVGGVCLSVYKRAVNLLDVGFCCVLSTSADGTGHWPCDFFSVQRGVGVPVSGGLEALLGRVGLPVGHAVYPSGTARATETTVQGKPTLLLLIIHFVQSSSFPPVPRVHWRKVPSRDGWSPGKRRPGSDVRSGI